MRRTDVAALLLVVFAALMPAGATAALLVGRSAPHLARVVLGVEAFRLMLLVHALAAFVLPRLAWRRTAPLVRAPAADPEDISEALARRVLLAICVLGLVLRLPHLGRGLWFDEIDTLVRYARASLGQILTTFDSQNQHMAYSVLAHLSLRVVGDDAAGVRLPAVLLGVASLWAVARLGALLASRREGLLAALLLAVSYHHVWFSQDARGYTGLLLWSVVGTELFIRLLEREEPGGLDLAVAYAAAMALALFTHLTALFVVAAHGLVWLLTLARARRREGAAWLPLVGFVLAGTLTLQAYAFVLPRVLRGGVNPAMRDSGMVWQKPAWAVMEALRVLASGVPGGGVVLLVAAAVAMTGMVSFARRSPWRSAVLLLPALMTVAGLALTSHNLWPRFFFFCAGFAVLIAVRGGFAVAARALPRQGARAATWVTAALAAASLATVPRAWGPKQDFDGARAWLERNRAAGDAVVVVDMTTLPYTPYLRGAWQVVQGEADLAVVERTHRRTWIAYTFPARLRVVQPGIWRRVERDYRPAREFPGTVGGGAVVIKVRG
jgi:mannosyltransferase